MTTIILQIVLLQLVFGLIYEVFLRKESFFVANRFFLLFLLFVSFSIPFVELSFSNFSNPIAAQFWLDEIVLQAQQSSNQAFIGNEVVAQSEQISMFAILKFIWILGAVLFAIRFFLKIIQLNRMRKNADVEVIRNQKIFKIQNTSVAFSFLNFIFIGTKVPVDHLKTIVKHEQIHIKQKHSWDLLALEILKIFFWWNPMLYWFQSRLTEVHEFLVDAHFKNKTSYYHKLLQTLFEVPNFSFANSFFSKSFIKTRLLMLNKNSNPRKSWRYALVLPVIAAVLFLNCTQEKPLNSETNADIKTQEGSVEYFMEEAMNKKKQGVSYETQNELLIQQKANKTKDEFGLNQEYALYLLMMAENNQSKIQFRTVNSYMNQSSDNLQNPDAIPFAIVNTYPVYENANPTDKDFFMNYIQKHIRENFEYPNEAMDAGIQGRVIVSFTIDEFGEININSVRGPSPILEESVHELMLKLPKSSTPATLDGKPVAMKMSVPITFKLD